MITTGADNVLGLHWLVRGTSCGSWSGTPNLDIVGKKFVVKTFAVKADVVGRARVVRAMIQKVDVLVNHVRLSCVAVYDN